ncbi:hypothetical protein ABZ499_35465 [Streptomyces sp. NPDC019990]
MVKELVGADYVQHDKSVPGGADEQVKQFKDVKAKIPGVGDRQARGRGR